MYDLRQVLAAVLLLGRSLGTHLGRGRAGRVVRRQAEAGCKYGAARPWQSCVGNQRLPAPVGYGSQMNEMGAPQPHHPPPPTPHGSTPRMLVPRQARGLTWMCSSVKMVCSCIWGTGVLVVTDVSRICLKTCNEDNGPMIQGQ